MRLTHLAAVTLMCKAAIVSRKMATRRFRLLTPPISLKTMFLVCCLCQELASGRKKRDYIRRVESAIHSQNLKEAKGTKVLFVKFEKIVNKGSVCQNLM